ncbi:MAG: hypothetical protein HYZ27_03510, partial [Deltaproteobacteria bacterium]|nr:hypothetical protein [Deltaproteobacteria bacterium]
VWLATETSLAAGATDTEYFLYYGYAGAPAPTFNEDQVFHWADFFDRADSEFVGNGWRIIDASTGSLGDVDINANALFFETTGDYQNRPVAEHTFPAITTAIEWRFGFDWAQGTEATYRVAMQIGDSTVMSDPPNANDLASTGTGASLVWVSSEQCTSPCLDEQVVYSSTLGNGVLGTATGLHDFSIVADLATDTFEFWVDGGWRNVGDFYAARLQLDKIRFFTWQVSQAGVVGRRFTYTLVRPYVSPEPQATLAGVEQADCN